MLLPSLMAQLPPAKMALLVLLGFALIVGSTVAGYRHRSAEKARLLTDIHRLDIPAAGYAIETRALSNPPEADAWRAYCEQERVTLIAEARTAAAQ